MRRRNFITLVGSAAVGWPLGAHAQRAEPIPRLVGMLMPQAQGDAEGKVRATAFEQELQKLGWVSSRNLRIEYRWAAGNLVRSNEYAAELVRLGPDAIVTTGSIGVQPLLKSTNSIPIVFVAVVDPVGAGYVESLARPGGNATGFINFEYEIGTKWLGLLKQISPSVTHVAVLRDPSLPSGSGQLGSIQAASSSFGMDIRPIDARNEIGLDNLVTTFAKEAHGGLVVTASAPTLVHRGLIIMLAARNKLPAIYPYRYFADQGGLISYGPDTVEQFRRAAGYVDRILRGEKPADLPVQVPTKYQLVINLKTAKALGLTVPPPLLTAADEVIE